MGITSLPAAALQLLVFGVDALEATELPSCLAAILFYLMEPRGKLIIYYLLLLCCVLGCGTWNSQFRFMVLASK